MDCIFRGLYSVDYVNRISLKITLSNEIPTCFISASSFGLICYVINNLIKYYCCPIKIYLKHKK